MNEKRREYLAQLTLEMVAAFVAATTTWFMSGMGLTVVVAFIGGLLYGHMMYELWLVLINTFGSTFFEDEDDEGPTSMDAIQGCIALLLPVGAVVAIVVVVIGLVISGGVYVYNSALGRGKATPA